MADKEFVGYVSTKHTKFGDFTRVSFNESDLEKLKSFLNEKGWVNVDIKESKSGKTYLQIDTWRPDGGSDDVDIAMPKDESGDLPF